ncbi:HutD/Ves family protein [Paracoccus binzhouensis]|uniref:HutD/Ves family protein n=1 Tax=Paracoccus binzhouensis TaxID=2796149 RepID=UPI0018EED293|nr:HutD family protein [Paracoccus binzhouensis]
MQDLLHLPETGYRTLPWKNGAGRTDEIWLWPPGADRDAFSIRISRAPIPQDGAFSSFQGADRVITVIEGLGLDLDFGPEARRLEPLDPFRFDTALAPVGRPLGGAVRVFNVMADRRDWRIVGAGLARAGDSVTAGLLVILALEAQRIRIGQADRALAAQDTAVCRAAGPVRLGGRALAVRLEPAA